MAASSCYVISFLYGFHADIDKVTAVEIVKKDYPQFQIDGELQLDAIVPEIGASNPNIKLLDVQMADFPRS